MILIAISFHSNEKMGAGGKGTRNFCYQASQSKESAFFDIKRALQNGHFRSFAEKGRGPEPQSPLAARLGL